MKRKYVFAENLLFINNTLKQFPNIFMTDIQFY